MVSSPGLFVLRATKRDDSLARLYKYGAAAIVDFHKSAELARRRQRA
jgi:hypothetical protein